MHDPLHLVFATLLPVVALAHPPVGRTLETSIAELETFERVCDERPCLSSIGGDCCVSERPNVETAACASGYELVYDGSKCWGRGLSFVCVDHSVSGISPPKAYGGCGLAYENVQLNYENNVVPEYFYAGPMEKRSKSLFQCNERCLSKGGVPACPTSQAQYETIKNGMNYQKFVKGMTGASWLGIYAPPDTEEGDLAKRRTFSQCGKVDDINEGLAYASNADWSRKDGLNEPQNGGNNCDANEYCVVMDVKGYYDIACDTDPDEHFDNDELKYNCLCEKGTRKEGFEEEEEMLQEQKDRERHWEGDLREEAKAAVTPGGEDAACCGGGSQVQ
ncbi:hypothetical protein TrLO_g3779 [Triparma laevis f. longispina]|uniref:C-type lectin domain-containing protein n=1 Tax=Triparma laevis f. longispina TaxID=1714387 RepID=A0A9W7KZF9_9STRA|nr:hypothetical protein TrLO_g3779 [Triparma laevis f. longispina]